MYIKNKKYVEPYGQHRWAVPGLFHSMISFEVPFTHYDILMFLASPVIFQH